MKICTKCGFPKETTEFNKRKAGKDGLTAWCKTCCRTDNALRAPKYAAKNREYRKRYEAKPIVQARLKLRYELNKDQIRERTKKHYWSLAGQFNQYRKTARKRGLSFELSKDDCSLFYNKTCSYCGDSFVGLGIDRVNNLVGYILPNCVTCCTKCNTMKMALTLNTFKEHIIKISNRLNLWENIKK